MLVRRVPMIDWAGMMAAPRRRGADSSPLGVEPVRLSAASMQSSTQLTCRNATPKAAPLARL